MQAKRCKIVHSIQFTVRIRMINAVKLYFCGDNMTSSTKYSYIFFDLDKTLWDFETNSALVLREIYSDFGLEDFFPTSEHFITSYNRHNDRLWDDYRKGLTTKEILRNQRFELTLAEAGLSDTEICVQIGDYYLDQSPKRSILIPGSREILDYLRDRKYHLYILTNGFRTTQIGKMTNSGIIGYFERMFTSEEIGFNKPRKEIFHWAVSSLNAKKNECLMIGDDNKVDIEGAALYGIDAVWFNPEQRDESTRAILSISTLHELRSLL